MAQYEMNLRDYWRIIVRRRVTILVCMTLTALFTAALAYTKVPVYQATASIKFEQSTTLTGLFVEVLSFSPADSIETQAAVIRSFPIIEKVAKRLGMIPERVGADDILASKNFSEVVASLQNQVKTQRVGTTNIIDITATSSNPQEAKDIANAVAEVYREEQSRARNRRIVEARQFIEQQLKEMEERVKQAEEAVWAFRVANRIISPGSESQILLSLVSNIRTELEKSQQQRVELEQAVNRIRQLDSVPERERDRVVVDATSQGMAKLQTTLVDLLIERSNLALEATDQHPRLQAINDRIREVRGEIIRELSGQVALLKSREEILNRQMNELFLRSRDVPSTELNLARLQRVAKISDDLYSNLRVKHQEALIKEAERIEEVSVVRPATDPALPVSSGTVNMVVIGAVIGLVLGLVLAFVQETLDTSIGTIEDVESYLEVPVLGVIPHIEAGEVVDRLIEHRPELASMDREDLERHGLLITHFDPKAPVAEAYRTLRTNLQFATMERGGKTFIVTSSSLQEGKTTTIVNLAVTLAQMGQKTLIVGANLRRPSIYKIFGIDREPGLSDILLGNYRWEECVRTVADILMGRFEMEDVMMTPGLDNLHLITAGASPPNPSELLGTPQMAEFIRQVRERYDIVLFDTPPVLPVADAAILASQVDGVLLCYQAGKVGRVALRRAKIHLENARGRVWGVVLNDIRAEITGYTTYHHYYTHYYAEEAGAEGPPATGVRRLLNRIGALFSRGSAPSQEVQQSRQIGRPTIEQELPPAPQKRYAHFWLGVVLLIILATLLVGFLMWRFGLWSPMRSGSVQELLSARWSALVSSKDRGLQPPATSEHDAAAIMSDTASTTNQPENAPAKADGGIATPKAGPAFPRAESRSAVI
ncbi:MAG TPA: AAA family ATPase, partial [Methylomirabilota bacterium]|nr:AAA family ATPase [Methylomirabilota bacterium]